MLMHDLAAVHFVSLCRLARSPARSPPQISSPPQRSNIVYLIHPFRFLSLYL